MSETGALLARMHAADGRAVAAVGEALDAIERAVDLLARRLEGGGRWIYVGAGTSGRLGALDAAELPPTFGTEPALVTALLAGGERAMLHAVEGAEDDEAAARRDVEAAGLSGRDAVVGIAASGRTPYVLAALRSARERGAATVAVVCAPAAPAAALADVAVVLDVGPEVLAGSTRLKAGTAQKLALNMLSTAVLARLGRVYRGEMVAMRPTNAKLRARAVRIVSDLLGRSAGEAEALLSAAGWELPVALVSGRWSLRPEAAAAHLQTRRGHVGNALEEAPSSAPDLA